MSEERREGQLSNVMNVFGFGLEEVEEAMKQKEQEKLNARDGRICACGHPVKHHDVTRLGAVSCQPGRQLCPCVKLHPVIKVPDTRYFMRKSEGNGKLHALTMGIVASIKSKPETENLMEWIVPIICEKCGNEEVSLFPTNVTPDGVVVDEPSKFSLLLCEDCRFG